MKLKKSISFALWSAVLIASLAVSILFVITTYYNIPLLPNHLVLFYILMFILTFFISQYRVERFIFKRIQKIYKNLNLTTANSKKLNTNIDELSDEIARFATTKHTEIEGLKERENYRKEFLGNVSHELKTPIFTIQGYIDILLNGAINDENIREKYLIRAQKGVERLSFIVNDLNLISQLETGIIRLNKTTFDIVETIQNSIDSLEIQSKEKNIVLGFNKTYDIPIFVFADKKRIEQVLQNLIHNAINYTNAATAVIISINYLQKNKIEITIKDEGDGISEADQERLFERFYRVDKSRSRHQGGTGLGLSIVKHIMEAHNESVAVHSELGKGATFSFTLELV